MGERHTLRLYKGCSEAAFRDHLARAARELGGEVIWDEPGSRDRDLRLASAGEVHSVYVPHQSHDVAFCRSVGAVSGLPWIELRIQEGSLWDYCLFRGTECLDRFSVCPQYWHNPDISEELLREQRGQPRVLANAWGVPVERIERYLVNWGYVEDPDDTGVFDCVLTGFAYPDDKHPYGDYEQFYDVLRVLGGVEPTELHTIVLPEARPDRVT